MKFALSVVLFAIVALMANAQVSNLDTTEEVYRWTQEIVQALSADKVSHDIVLHVDENTKIIVTDKDAPTGGEYKGMIGYWQFVETSFHDFNVSQKNFTILDVNPAYYRSLIKANFKLTEKLSQSQTPKQTNWQGAIYLHFDVLGKLKHMVIVDENQEQTCLDLSPKGIQLLNSLEWAYFKTPPPLTLQSDFWNLVDDSIVVNYKNLPSQLFNSSTLSGKQAILQRCQDWDKLLMPSSMTPDVRSLMDLMFHYKLKIKTLFADDTSVISMIKFGQFKMISKHVFSNDKLTSLTLTFTQLLKPWQILSSPAMNNQLPSSISSNSSSSQSSSSPNQTQGSSNQNQGTQQQQQQRPIQNQNQNRMGNQ